MTGTPEERLTKRQLDRREIARKNGILRDFGNVRPGTVALLHHHRKSVSMDAFLFKLMRWGEKNGYL